MYESYSGDQCSAVQFSSYSRQRTRQHADSMRAAKRADAKGEGGEGVRANRLRRQFHSPPSLYLTLSTAKANNFGYTCIKGFHSPAATHRGKAVRAAILSASSSSLAARPQAEGRGGGRRGRGVSWAGDEQGRKKQPNPTKTQTPPADSFTQQRTAAVEEKRAYKHETLTQGWMHLKDKLQRSSVLILAQSATFKHTATKSVGIAGLRKR